MEEYQVRRNNLFQEFEKESWDQRLFLFRESIVKRSEFVRILLNFEKGQSKQILRKSIAFSCRADSALTVNL